MRYRPNPTRERISNHPPHINFFNFYESLIIDIIFKKREKKILKSDRRAKCDNFRLLFHS